MKQEARRQSFSWKLRLLGEAKAGVVHRSHLHLNRIRVSIELLRLLIPDMPQRIDEIALEESLFWLRQNMEHASVLSLYFRPVVQDALYKTTKGHEGRLSDVYNTALNVNKSKTGLPKLLRNARQVVGDWDAFLRQLFDNVVHCRVPTGETNLWPILDDHLAREAEYYLTVLDIIENVPGPQGGHRHSH